MFRSLRNIARLCRILRCFGKENALFPDEIKKYSSFAAFIAQFLSNSKAEGRPGERLSRAFVACGPSFIKFGQALSCRADLLGEDITHDLTQLQDRLAPFPADQAKEIIEDSLKASIEDLFEFFDPNAVAAASIAQVHKARTKPTDQTPYGKDVAVKVLRPNVKALFLKDLDLLYWLAHLALKVFPKLQRLRPVDVVAKFEETTLKEMDLRLEAASAAELRENFANDPTFHVPEIDWSRTSDSVMVMEWIYGAKLNRAEELITEEITPREVLKNASAIFFKQIFRDGFFHADMHPGNVFIHGDNSITAIDFGIMGRLSPKNRNFLVDMLIGFLEGDYRKVAQVHFDAGWVPDDQDPDSFMQAIRAIGEPLMDRPLEEISIAQLLAQLFQVTERFNMHTQPQLLLLQKSLLTAEGMGRTLDPSVNMWAVIRPLIEEWMIENRGVKARILEKITDFNTTLTALPKTLEKLEKFVDTIDKQGVKLDPKRPKRSPSLPWMLLCLLLTGYCLYLSGFFDSF